MKFTNRVGLALILTALGWLTIHIDRLPPGRDRLWELEGYTIYFVQAIGVAMLVAEKRK